MLAELNSRRFVDKSVGQCWATLLDEGTYLCSMSTMHRLLRRAGQAGERRRQATHPARVKPELLATAPAAGVELGHRAPRGVREPWRWWEAIAGCLSQQAFGSWRTVDCLGVGVVGGAVLDNDESFQYCQMGRARLARRRGIREEPAAESSSRRNHRPETWRTWVGSHRAPVGLRSAGNFPDG